ncbi:MAG: hypothetical protein SGBAC_008869 [Bacillariaceae sp.]
MNHHFSSQRRNLEPSLEDKADCSKISISVASINRTGEQLKPDFSIFAANKEGDLFEPISIDPHRTQSQQMALNSALQQSIEFLFGCSNLKATPIELNRSDTSPACATGQAQGTFSLWRKIPNESNKKRKREDDSVPTNSTSRKFRQFYVEQWDTRYDDLIEYRKKNGHCCIPYDYPPNPSLARWVKRQRYQYKLYIEKLPSAMTKQRVQALDKLGFIWDARLAIWERRLAELKLFRAKHGHCNVPSTYQASKSFAAWMQSQRRQYKLHGTSRPTAIAQYRIEALNRLGFEWESVIAQGALDSSIEG